MLLLKQLLNRKTSYRELDVNDRMARCFAEPDENVYNKNKIELLFELLKEAFFCLEETEGLNKDRKKGVQDKD